MERCPPLIYILCVTSLLVCLSSARTFKDWKLYTDKELDEIYRTWDEQEDPDSYSSDDPDALDENGVPNIVSMTQPPEMIFVDFSEKDYKGKLMSIAERWTAQLQAAGVEIRAYPVEPNSIVIGVKGGYPLVRTREFLYMQPEPLVYKIKNIPFLPKARGGKSTTSAATKAGGPRRLKDLPESAKQNYPGGREAFEAAVAAEEASLSSAGDENQALGDVLSAETLLPTGEELRERKRQRAAKLREQKKALMQERKRRQKEKKKGLGKTKVDTKPSTIKTEL